jgi:signal transduction histidine kinase
MKLLLDAQRADDYPQVDGSNTSIPRQSFAQQMPLWKVIEGCVIRVAQSGDFVEKKLSFDLDLNSSSIIVDTHAFERLISNLLENAVRFSPSDGVINIACVRETRWFELVITDQGQGFPENELGEILPPVSEEPTLPVTSLGLFLCSRIVEAYGGGIMCANQLNSGAKVTIRIPM